MSEMQYGLGLKKDRARNGKKSRNQWKYIKDNCSDQYVGGPYSGCFAGADFSE